MPFIMTKFGSCFRTLAVTLVSVFLSEKLLCIYIYVYLYTPVFFYSIPIDRTCVASSVQFPFILLQPL